MEKTFTFVVFLTVFLIAQLVCSQPLEMENEVESGDNQRKITVEKSIKMTTIKPLIRRNTKKLTTLRSKPNKISTGSAKKQTMAESVDKPEKSPSTEPINETVPIQTSKFDESRVILEGFDKTVLDRFNGGHKCFNRPDYYNVCLSKGSRSLSVHWDNKKDGTLVEFYVNINGDVEQKWNFDNNKVLVRIDKKFNKKDETFSTKWFGPEDPQSVEKYKTYIKTWCAYNYDFVGEDNCVIY